MSRRLPGEGTIYRRSDGRLVAEVSVGRRGARKKLSEYVPEDADPVKVLEQLRRRAGVMTPADAHVQTVEQFLLWWTGVELPARVTDPGDNFVDSTLESYQSRVRRYLIPLLGHHRLSQLSPQHIRGMMRTLATTPGVRGKPLGPRSIEYIHAILRSALACAVEYELVDRNVAKLVKPPTVVRRDPTLLPEDTARRIMAAVAGDRLEAFWVAPLTVGMRPGEARALAWDCVDLEANTVTVRRNLVRVGGKLVVHDTKTHRRRHVQIPGFVVELLRAHRVRQLEERLKLGAAYRPSRLIDADGTHLDLCFTTVDGRPLRADWVEDELTAICARAGVERMTPHEFFRHGGATLMLLMGVPLETIKELLGHSSIKVTEGYAHVVDESKKQAADRWQERFGTANPTGTDRHGQRTPAESSGPTRRRAPRS